MPIYSYTCTACQHIVEKRQSFSDPPLTTCEQCGGALRKIIHPVGIVFKGSGWYVTDSRTSSAGASGAAAAADKSSAPKTDGASPSESSSSNGQTKSGESATPSAASKDAASTPSATPASGNSTGSDKS